MSMTIPAFTRSAELRRRAHRVIPAGCHTYSKGDDQFPELAPGFIASASGCYAYDVDGNELLDWGMGLRAVILGHSYPRVNEAAIDQIRRGTNFTRPSTLEMAFAEEITELIPSAEMVKFAKNGSDVTTAAVRLARAATGRDLIAICREHPFFSVDDWFIGTTPCNAGIPDAITQQSLTFHYNDLPSLERLFEAYPGQIAGVILEAVTTDPPIPGFLEGVRALATKHGTVLIFDEMISGFRWHPSGAQTYFNVTPDLATFGKAIGNGFAVSALVGKREIMELGGLHHDKPRVFLLSTTHGGETHALAAAQATVREIVERDVVSHLWTIGSRLQDGFNEVVRRLGLGAYARCAGYPCSPVIIFNDPAGVPANGLRTLFHQEMIAQGILIPYIAPSFSHDIGEVDRTVEAAERALQRVASVIGGDPLDQHLVGPVARPVFRRFNTEG